MKINMRIVRVGYDHKHIKALVAANDDDRSALGDMNLAIDDRITVEIKKQRNPKFHRLAHALGGLIAENVDKFRGLDHHEVLKRLQVESGIHCDLQTIWHDFGKRKVSRLVKGKRVMVKLGRVKQTVLVARSMSFDKMSETRFTQLISGLCNYVIETYWHGCTVLEILDLAEEWMRGRE